jgi:hypothetical protein
MKHAGSFARKKPLFPKYPAKGDNTHLKDKIWKI